ncbi:DNA binding protein [Aureococcus anophagefferens]|nr:DNA binding protein [Aureococcus anophagefferens]
MLALLLLLRAAAATTDDVVVQRGAVDHATVAALAADIAGQPAAKGWMAVPGAVAALLGDAGAVKAPYRVAAGAVEAHRDTEDGAAVDGDVSVLYVGADAGATFVLVDAATGAETRVPVEAGTLIRWRNGRFSHRVDAEDQRRALLGPAAPKAGGGLRAVGNAQADDGLQCASGEFAITFGYRPSGAAWGSMNSYPDAEEMCLAPSCFVKTFQLTETIDEAAGLSFAVVDAGSPQSEASVRVYGDDEITWYFCIDSDGSVSRYPSAAPTASARPTPGPCGGARLLGYAFDDANACANRAAATKTCGAHLQYSPRVDEVGCWCCPEAFEPPGDASSEFALYEIRACDAPTAAPSDAPSFSPTPYPSPSCGFYATLFSATFLPSGAAWASARASVFYGTWDADRDPATNPLIATLAYPFPDLDYLCVAPGCYTLVFEGDADGLRFTIASPVADQTVTVETSDLAFCTDEEGHFDRAPTAAPTATASPSRAPSAGGLALAEPWNCTNGTAAQVLPLGDAYVIAALDGGSGTYRVNRYLDVPSGAQVNAVAMASPDAAAGLFGSYYYAARPGAPASTGAFYWVEDARGAAAYRGAAPFRVADALFPHGGVHDVAGIVEQPGDDDLILDGILGGAYLVGLGCGFEVLVVRLHEDSGAPEAYAVMTPPSTVAWNGADPQALVTSGFGAAWAFGKGARTRAFFAENAGLGVFEVLFR